MLGGVEVKVRAQCRPVKYYTSINVALDTVMLKRGSCPDFGQNIRMQNCLRYHCMMLHWDFPSASSLAFC